MIIQNRNRKSDPETIDRLITAIHDGLCDGVVEGETSPSEVLSALITSIHWFLTELNERATESEREENAVELQRVFGDLMLEFGVTMDAKKVN